MVIEFNWPIVGSVATSLFHNFREFLHCKAVVYIIVQTVSSYVWLTAVTCDFKGILTELKFGFRKDLILVLIIICLENYEKCDSL